MFPLFMLLGLVAVAASSSDDSSSSSSTTPGGGAGDPGDHIELTCDQAVAAMPDATRPAVVEAILHGTDRTALYALATYLETTAAPAAPSSYLAGAYLIVAHCVRARADSLSSAVQPQIGASGIRPGPLSATGSAGVSYAEPAGGY